MPEHKTGSGLTIGAGHTNNAKFFTWPMIFGAGYETLSVMIGKNRIVVKGKFF